MDKYVPPFKLTPKILDLSTRIAALIGRYEGLNLPLPKIQLRKENRIKTIHGTVAIEGNTLTVEQITAILEGKPDSRIPVHGACKFVNFRQNSCLSRQARLQRK